MKDNERIDSQHSGRQAMTMTPTAQNAVQKMAGADDLQKGRQAVTMTPLPAKQPVNNPAPVRETVKKK